MIYKNFYIELGNLLYAIAKSDGLVREKEWKLVHEKVVNDLVPNEPHTDEYGMDAAYYVEMQFESLHEDDADANDAFTSFIQYVNEHHTALDGRLRKAIVDISQAVADAFKGTNSHEEQMLMKLKHKLSEFEKV